MTPPSADDRYVVPWGRRDGRSKAGCNSIPLFSCQYLPRSRNHTRTCGKRHHPSHFCFLLQFPHPLSLPHTFPIHVFNTRLRLSSQLARLMSPTILLDTHSRHSSSTRNTHMSSVYISSPYIQTASRTARYALRITDRHIHKVISVIRPFREHRGIHTPYPTLGADLTKKGGEFSFASPIVLS